MNCFVCKGTMTNSITNHFVTLDNGCMVIIKQVPCMRCTQCGEVWYNGTVAKKLEDITNTLEQSLAEVSIVSYPDKVA